MATLFSQRDKVGWEAKSLALSGALPTMILKAGALRHIGPDLVFGRL